MEDIVTKVTEEHFLPSEAKAAALIESAKKDKSFTLLKSSTEYKAIKEKGEVVEELWKTTLVKLFNDWKDPGCFVKITYDVDEGFFPNIEEDEE